MSRWKAAAVHLGLSALIATIVIATMYGLWYPPPYFALMGGALLVLLIVGCDVVIGPLITLIIFKAGKKGLRFDLAVIALVQVAALAYGVSNMYAFRPVFTVFAVDRFEIVSPAEIKPEALAQARYPEFASFSLTGPRLVGAEMPQDQEDKNKLLFGEFGGDLNSLPQFYVPYERIAGEVAKRAKPITTLEDKNPDAKDRIVATIGRLGQPPDQLGYVPIMGRFSDMAAIVDKNNGRMLDVVDAKPW